MVNILFHCLVLFKWRKEKERKYPEKFNDYGRMVKAGMKERKNGELIRKVDMFRNDPEVKSHFRLVQTKKIRRIK